MSTRALAASSLVVPRLLRTECGSSASPQSLRFFSTSSSRHLAEIRSVATLPKRTVPRYLQSTKPGSSLLSLRWPRPPRNLLLVQKLYSAEVSQSVVRFAKYVRSEYPEVNFVVEPRTSSSIQEQLGFPIHVPDGGSNMADKIDVIATFGGDGTVLRAASLFKLHGSVPPILSFSMGTLGFLGEWDFREHKKAWREMYMSGSDVAVQDAAVPRGGRDGALEAAAASFPGWECMRGKSLGVRRASKILLRHRIKADIFDGAGTNVNHHVAESQPELAGTEEPSPSLRAINEISVHRGSHPHLAVIDVYQNGHFLTETTADGILVSTPTGSTAYSLSAGGPIVHPLVKSLLITSISPCSLSFRSLVLPLDTKVCLRMSAKNRGRELDLSIDGKRCLGVSPGTEIRIEGEFVGRAGPGEEWHGGVPCVIKAEDDDPWVGGLNGLLKFNHPFGREPHSDEFSD
ncbi:ATP-NAD kinase family protein [Drechmeria coniospora]|uniref:ATP-NAD kinase family protein n=1 Tax=Drechmeria coniospora TaxID=98403 RepID=A0A151GJ86_DRECN|nr:ATP-NAD kinase family protein [Drechmeria coniospora]KYK57148.1 ATP-NAD kinase family protein [Drechmeria coniospora]ODA79055.1 hypothetical protein RJ55_04646 [Drechmeria coniospora]